MRGQTLRGWIAQGLDGRRRVSADLVSTIDVGAGAGSYLAPVDCVVIARAWGGGGSGGADSTLLRAGGGGGGAAGYRSFRMASGQWISWNVGVGGASRAPDGTGNAGADTALVLPSGVVLTAGGGAPGTNGGSNPIGGAGGQPTGPWDIPRIGGAGGQGGPATGAGGSPSGGGSGGAVSASYGGGGGAAGFVDLHAGPQPGNGGPGGTGSPTGSGGSGGGNSSQPGGPGRLILLILRTN